ncbi:hypothetical protein ABIF69_004417 [Bradyrhizobium japonicum]
MDLSDGSLGACRDSIKWPAAASCGCEGFGVLPKKQETEKIVVRMLPKKLSALRCDPDLKLPDPEDARLDENLVVRRPLDVVRERDLTESTLFTLGELADVAMHQPSRQDARQFVELAPFMDPARLGRQSEAGAEDLPFGSARRSAVSRPPVQDEPESALAIGPHELRNRTLSQPVDHGERSSEDMRKPTAT